MIYLFDLDGTLIDSMQQWAKNVHLILDEHGVLYPDNIVQIITPMGDQAAAEYMIQLGLPKTVDEVYELMDRCALEDYAHHIPAKPYVAEVLRALKKEGHSLNVLTACMHKMLDVCLKRLDLWDLFDNIWSCEDFSDSKSNPNIYLRACEKMGCRPEACTFLDDNLSALSAAKQAGLTTIGVFDEFSSDMEQEIRNAADRYIYDFRALL